MRQPSPFLMKLSGATPATLTTRRTAAKPPDTKPSVSGSIGFLCIVYRFLGIGPFNVFYSHYKISITLVNLVVLAAESDS